MRLRNEEICDGVIEKEKTMMESMEVKMESKWKIISTAHTSKQHIAHTSV